MSQVIRPRIPYQGAIYDGLHEMKQIKITGSVPFGADRFTVNFMNGPDSESNHPLHLSVRFKCNTVVRNVYQNHSWGAEERNGPFPFAIGRKFIMVIVVDRSAYKIYVNGEHCWDFAHRLHFSRARSLKIDGDVNIERIEYFNYDPSVFSPIRDETGSRPDSPSLFSLFSQLIVEGLTTPTHVNVRGASSNYVQPLPCVFPIHGGIRPGMSIHITGRPTSNPNRFSFNIQKGNATHPPPDVAFHFDVRFNNRSIVRNSRMNDVWYAEESLISHFPFQPDSNFDVTIHVQTDAYAVTVNGKHFVSFRHRLNAFQHFNVLSIQNDVIITSIRYI